MIDSSTSDINVGHANSDQNQLYHDIDCFTFGPPLYKSPRIFSRATCAARILVDVPGHGYHVFVLKDAWHERTQMPESAFYERIHQRYAELRTKPEFDWVREIYSDFDRYPHRIPGLADFYGYLDLSTLECSLHPEGSGYTTVTRRLMKDGISYESNRICSLSGPVGARLDNFGRTKDVVVAMRDAIMGHFIAYSCGVLHRDISIGNILAADRYNQLQGFLHDFDQATFTSCDGEFEKSRDKSGIESDNLNTMIGTRQFLATGVLAEPVSEPHMPHHGLESFYWVFIWILLRYTKHHHENGVRACSDLFDHSKLYIARAVKLSWLVLSNPLNIEDNKPLNALLDDLHLLIGRFILKFIPGERKQYVTHREFAETLHKALSSGDWPINDASCKWASISRSNESSY